MYVFCFLVNVNFSIYNTLFLYVLTFSEIIQWCLSLF